MPKFPASRYPYVHLDFDYKNPAADGETDVMEFVHPTDIQFNLNIFNDSNFELPVPTGYVVDIGPQALIDQQIFVQGKVEFKLFTIFLV